MPRLNFALDPAQRLDARRAFNLLAGSGLTLEAAAIRALQGQRALVHVPTADAVERFHLSRLRKTSRRGAPLRRATIEWYEEKLGPLIESGFATRPIDGIGRTEFRRWLEVLETGITNRAAIARACRALWRWAMTEDPPLAMEDVTIGCAFGSTTGEGNEQPILSVAHARAMLAGATGDRSALALMLFAGLRPEEIAGIGKPPLRWEHVNKVEKWIRVPAEIAKSGKPRLLEGLPPTVWQWLEPGELRAPVSPCSARTLRERAKAAAGLDPLPQDCLRHTAATYLLAATQNAGKVAEWLGHEGRPTLLHQIYRGRLTTAHEQVNRAMAREYFALRPG